MKKWIKDVVITIVSLAIICAVFFKIGWVSSWKEVVALYGIMVMVIVLNTLPKYTVTKIRSSIDQKE